MDSRRAGGGNRMMTSTTLQTNDIWSKTIGHDPHAGDAEAAVGLKVRGGAVALVRLDTQPQGHHQDQARHRQRPAVGAVPRH